MTSSNSNQFAKYFHHYIIRIKFAEFSIKGLYLNIAATLRREAQNIQKRQK